MSSNTMHKAERLVIGTFPVGMKPTARKGQPPSGRKRLGEEARALALAPLSSALVFRPCLPPLSCARRAAALSLPWVSYTRRLFSLPSLRFT